jgi:hypothetical protein
MRTEVSVFTPAYQRPNEQVLTPIAEGTTSHQRSILPATGGGTVSHQDYSSVQCV